MYEIYNWVAQTIHLGLWIQHLVAFPGTSNEMCPFLQLSQLKERTRVVRCLYPRRDPTILATNSIRDGVTEPVQSLCSAALTACFGPRRAENAWRIQPEEGEVFGSAKSSVRIEKENRHPFHFYPYIRSPACNITTTTTRTTELNMNNVYDKYVCVYRYTKNIYILYTSKCPPPPPA